MYTPHAPEGVYDTEPVTVPYTAAVTVECSPRSTSIRSPLVQNVCTYVCVISPVNLVEYPYSTECMYVCVCYFPSQLS